MRFTLSFDTAFSRCSYGGGAPHNLHTFRLCGFRFVKSDRKTDTKSFLLFPANRFFTYSSAHS